MGIKVKKSFSRQELADFLADLSAQVRRGRMQGETRVWTVPEQVEASIHLKEEDGEVLTKIKLRWPMGAGRQAVAEPASPQESRSLKDVKARLSVPFKELQRLIREGIVPDQKTVQDFVEHSRLFAKLAKPEWQELMAEYLAHVEKLQQAVTSGQMEAMQQELQALVDRMIVCHREFKK
ncbi:MAG: GAK system XXXCH domain-containing protein [Deltaproteobacteria bacterium]|nr:GAK system XXXCH domain-containing protein [Deltaproteobacteria bacterium]